MGENVTAIKTRNIIQEIISGVIFYNSINNLMAKRNA
jgi:hypothetical protein